MSLEPAQVCLVLIQPAASRIAAGEIRLIARGWNTQYRGDIVIASSHERDLKKIAQEPWIADLPYGKTLCLVNLVNVRKMEPEDEGKATGPYHKDFNVLVIKDVRRLEQVPIGLESGVFILEAKKVRLIQ